MAHLAHAIGVEPFEEATQSQGDSESTATSPEALKAFYAQMEHQETLQRKMSRSQSSKKRSLWSRKSTKKQVGAPTDLSVPAFGLKVASPMDSDQLEDDKLGDDKDKFDEKTEEQVASLVSRSIIPDPLGELPAWFIKEYDLAVGQATSYKIKYPIHSPVGPRFYKNQHLIPSSQLRAAARPPSVFSPSFPPMAASMHEHSEDSTSRPGLSRTPSGSPLATPSSSQADVAAKPRSRKTSQTTPDTVDLLDVTDPWGTHYHHQSPYDPGLTSSNGHVSPISPVEVDAQETPVSPRSRRSSMTAGQTRHRTVTPSPLSQSTSALHLQAPEIAPQLQRKLSKRRKPLLGNLLSGRDKEPDRLAQGAAPAPQLHAASPLPLHAESAPASPMEAHMATPSSTMPNGPHIGSELHKRHSTVPAVTSSNPYGTAITHHLRDKKEKRESVLGRLAKKLSIMKRPSDLVRGSAGSTDEWQHIGMGDVQSDRNARRSAVIHRHSLQERPLIEHRKTDPIKRVPPPALNTESSSDSALHAGPPAHSEDHRSIVSFEPTLAMGKLTVANPDAPSSADNTPVRSNVPLPADPESVHEVIQRPRASNDPQERPKSTLPPLPDSALDLASQGTATPVMPLAAASELLPTPQRRPSPAEIPQSPATTDPMSLYPMYMNGLSSPSVVPFPAADHRPSSVVSDSARATIASSPVSFMDDSPLSRASMIVNPPTPHNPTIPMMPTPVNPTNATGPNIQRYPKARVEVTKPKTEVGVKDELPKGATSVMSRQTETFKLIRTASGNVLPANETITAGGEQWEVVESSDGSKKNKAKERPSRSKDRDTGSRTQRRQGHSAPQETEADQRRARQRSFHEREVLAASVPIKSTRAHSIDIPRPNNEVSKHHRKESKFNLDKPQPPPPSSTPEPPTVGRRPSTSTRPTSELPSTAELGALRAREAWELDRLRKGKSMYGESEHNGSVSVTPQTREHRGPVSNVNTDLSRDNGTVRSSGHGSSHTSFVVQPFQGQVSANMFYSNMPSAPPPTIYSPTVLQQAPYPSSVPYDYSQSYRSLPPSFSFPPQDSLPETSARPNPLPPPPRESSYQPSPLPPLSDRSSRSNSDHWTKHLGITTAH